MSFFTRKNKNKPAYLDAPMNTYNVSYVSIREALANEVTPGSTDIKKLSFHTSSMFGNRYDIYHTNGQILHIVKDLNEFNLNSRAEYSLNDDEMKQLLSKRYEGEAKDAFLYCTVASVNTHAARVIYGELALRWFMEIDDLLQNTPAPLNINHSTEVIESPQQIAEIREWNFFNYTPSELHLLMMHYYESTQSRMKLFTDEIFVQEMVRNCNSTDAYTKLLNNNADIDELKNKQLSIQMSTQEYEGFWETSDDAMKATLHIAKNGGTIGNLVSEKLSLRLDNVFTSLEVLALDDKIRGNGEKLTLNEEEEEGLPPLEELVSFSAATKSTETSQHHHNHISETENTIDDSTVNQNKELSKEASKVIIAGKDTDNTKSASEEPNAEIHDEESAFTPVESNTDAPETAEAEQILKEANVDFTDEHVSHAQSRISFTPIPFGSVTLAPIFNTALAENAFSEDAIAVLTPLIKAADENAVIIKNIEKSLSEVTHDYSESSSEYSDMAMEREMQSLQNEEEVSQNHSDVEEEMQDTANNSFFVLEFMETKRRNANSARSECMQSILTELSKLPKTDSFVLLLQEVSSKSLEGSKEVNDIALVEDASPKALEEQENEFNKLKTIQESS